jgi:hypothetical protein
MRAPFRKRFDPSAEFVVRKPTGISGRPLKAGDPFPKELVSERRLRQMFDARSIIYSDEAPGARMSEAEVAASHRGQHAARAHEATKRRAEARRLKDAGELQPKKGASAKATTKAEPKPRKGVKANPIPRGMKGALAAKAAEAAARAEKRLVAKAEKEARLAAERAELAEQQERDRLAAEQAAADEKKRLEDEATAAAAEAETKRLAEEAAAAEAAKSGGSGNQTPPAEEPAAEEPAPGAPGAPAADAPAEDATETVTGPEAILAARALVEISPTWASDPWPDRLKTAAQLSDKPVKNGADAAAAIEAELARRGTS